VLCFAGSDEMPGAAVLVVRAALRAGAGLVTLSTASASLPAVLPVAAPEALLLAQPWSRLAASLARRGDHARVAGPGLGTGAATRRLVLALLAARGEVPLVLDADALNVLAGSWKALRKSRAPRVLTPHPGEAARLLGREVGADDRARIAAAREVAAQSGAICCLKGRATVVTDGERVYVNPTGNPGMATAGAGDVLSGILGAYLAATTSGLDRTWTPWDAACTAVHVHGLAGDLARRQLGTRGLIASDLIQFLPQAQERLAESLRLH